MVLIHGGEYICNQQKCVFFCLISLCDTIKIFCTFKCLTYCGNQMVKMPVLYYTHEYLCMQDIVNGGVNLVWHKKQMKQIEITTVSHIVYIHICTILFLKIKMANKIIVVIKKIMWPTRLQKIWSMYTFSGLQKF